MASSLQYVTNRNLFSNHYLENQLPDTDEWEDVDEDALEGAWQEVQEIYDEEEDLVENYNEDSLQSNFIDPVLEVLDHAFEVEETVERSNRTPDYAVFESEEERQSAILEKDERDFYRDSVSVGDAKRWEVSLDKISSTGENIHDFSNPSHQIHVYLQNTEPDWGFLTNGKHWRIYYSGTSHKLDSYYDVDLEAMLEDGDMGDFRYFYLFFRNQAFVEDASSKTFLERVYEGSNTFSKELGEDLKFNVYEALKVLAEGFLNYNDDLGEDDLDLIHDSSLTYLYRLIFVLYAESEGRDLLDTRNEIYDSQYSLNTLKKDVVEELDSADSGYRDWQDNLWDRLDELFILIDQGSKSRDIPEDDLYIPAYNGGLFRTDVDDDARQEAWFLQEYKVGDSYLARVIELLTRTESPEGSGKVFADYSSLDIRHLGSIYEILLEYNLNFASEPMVAVKDDGETWMPESDFDEAEDEGTVVERAAQGDIYLTTDSGERKATGSYYTPEYVVQYIVEETLDPLIEDVREDVVGSTTHSQDNFAEEFAEGIFDLKILDPAMGSGHFLTNAVDHLARQIIDAQEKQADAAGIETVDDSHDIHWARRQVAQKCIYGVDLNDMAVELAKVSLWLRTLAAEQPLAFLDHHLRIGNSLVGSDVTEILSNGDDDDDGDDEGARQVTIEESIGRVREQTLDHMMDLMKELLDVDNESLEDIKSMEELYREIQSDALYRRLRMLANVDTAEEFGVDVPDDALRRMADAIEDTESWNEVAGETWFQEAQELAEEQSFFHWELEFPAVFFDIDGQQREDAGFDAVIGNPPYVRQEQIKPNKPYFESRFRSYHGVADLYVYFIEQATVLLKDEGEFGYIVSNKFMRSNYGEGLRTLLVNNVKLSEVVDFGELPVFAEASAFPAILRFKNTEPVNGQSPRVSKIKSLDFSSLERVVENSSYTVTESGLEKEGWSLAGKKWASIADRMEEGGVTLEDYVNGEIYYGIKTGLNKAFFIDENTKRDLTSDDNNHLIEPLVVGDDIRRYKIRDKGRYLINIPSGWTSETSGYSNEDKAWGWLSDNYPNIATHLSEFEESARERYDSGEFWWELRPCDYESSFQDNKIIYPVIAMSPRFAFDEEGRYANDKCFIIPREDLYLLGVLNSRLLFEIAKMKVSVLGDEQEGGRLELRTIHIQNLPIPQIEFTTSDSKRGSRVSSLLDSYEDYLAGDTGKPLPEADDVAHDFLAELAEEMSDLKETRHSLNLSLFDHLGISTDDELQGPKLTKVGLTQPPDGVADSPLSKTKEDLDSLRVGRAEVHRPSATEVEVRLTARYKPEDADDSETDQWGYTETEPLPALRINDLSEVEADLVEAFVPRAVNEAGGFAGFYERATKSDSLVDRLKALRLPDPSNVETGLRSYRDTRERADDLDEKIEKTDELIDEIVYELYGLSDEEIEIVEETIED